MHFPREPRSIRALNHQKKVELRRKGKGALTQGLLFPLAEGRLWLFGRPLKLWGGPWVGLALFLLASLGVPQQGQCRETIWPDFNRTLSLRSVSLDQHYTEFDSYGFTSDGILDTEKGKIPGWGGQIRWQGQVAELPLWVQAGYLTLKGQTDYQGYLQSGTTLTPFSARSGNVLTHLSLALGVPLAWTNSFQVLPIIELSDHRWQRNLVGYGETYRSQTGSLGLLAQWRFASGWTIEGGGQVGRRFNDRVKVSELGFAAKLDHDPQWQTGLGLNYQILERVSVGAHWSHLRSRNQASEIVNGFQAPPARTRQNLLGVSLSWHY